MSNIKFSQLPNLGNITANTIVPVVSANTNYTVTAANLQSYVNSSTGNVTSGNLNSPTLNNSGNISVVASGYTWLFGSTGNLVLPRGGIVYETNIPDGALTGNTIALKPSGGTNNDQQLLVYPTATGADFNHLHLTSGNLYNTELFLGNDNLYVKLANTGNIVINSNDDAGNSAQWTFGTDGSLTLPIGVSIDYTGNIQYPKIIADSGKLFSIQGQGNSGSAALAWTVNPDAASQYAAVAVNRGGGDNLAKVVLTAQANSGDSANAKTWTFNEAGNLTLPGNTFAVNYANGTAVSLGGTYGNANVVANLAALGSNPVSTTGNVTGGNLLFGSGVITGTGNVTGGNVLTGGLISAAGTVTGTSHLGSVVSVTANITGGNLLTGGLISATSTITGTSHLGSVVSVTGNVTGGNILTAGVVTATGNIVTAGNFVGNGAALSNVTVSVAGNIIGTQSNVTLVAGAYSWTFNNAGNLTLPGNTFSVNYANNTQVNAVTRFEGSWTVPVGNSTQSFTVTASETYYMWVDCNIPNGILVWNATATVTNTNVPVVGAQYAWVYNGGGTPIDFTSIPNQFIGTANTIVRSNVAPSSTTNRFDFGINNTSAGNVTVRYGWIAIS
jgi:hypothetical protein